MYVHIYELLISNTYNLFSKASTILIFFQRNLLSDEEFEYASQSIFNVSEK